MFSSKLKFVRIGTFPWDSLVSAERHFLTVDVKQEIFSLSQSCICLHVSVCVVPQGRTPPGPGRWGPPLGSRSSDHCPDDGFLHPWLLSSWYWKGGFTPEGPNRDINDFGVI